VFVLFLLTVGILYVAYIGIEQNGSFISGLFGGGNTAPVSVLANEPEPDVNDGPDSVSLDGPPEALSTDRPDVPTSPPEGDMNPYAAFSFYIPENQLEYEVFAAENPALSHEEIVWMVNAGLYRSFYDSPEIITDTNPLLVNPYWRLPKDFVPEALEEIDGEGRKATPETIAAFNEMREAAVLEGHKLIVTSAYRTVEYQQKLYTKAGGDGSVARPTFSEHHTGRALDLWGPKGLLDEYESTETGRWVAEHAHEYGFTVRYTSENRHITGYIPEPWHITYVGDDIAEALHSGGYGSLEEYVAKNPDARLE
jgi:hypothetical protein